MSEYSIAIPFPAGLAPGFIGLTGAAQPLLEIQSGPTDYVRLLEIYFTTLFGSNTTPNSTVANFGLGIPAARGVGVNATLFSNQSGFNNDSPPGVQLMVFWSRTPTAPTTFMRRQSFVIHAGTGGVGPVLIPGIFRFPRGLSMPPSSSIVVWCISAPGLNAGTPQAIDPSFVTVDV